ncbi:MAG: MazG-like family protein [Bacillota bacterium]
MAPEVKTKTISLPRPNKLNPSLESTALKLMEEAGELAAAIIRFRGIDREKADIGPEQAMALSLELLDVAQTAVTMMFVLEEQYGIDMSAALDEHIAKLMRKGYLSL